MSLTDAQTSSVLTALALLLLAAHALGHVFARFRQPRVIGEILGGLVLGPTCFGYLLPDLQRAAFSSADGVTYPVLGAVYQLGLLLLMFCSGLEVRSGLRAGERRTAIVVTITGTVFPFALGLVFLQLHGWTGYDLLDVRRFYGPAESETAFLLIFAIAIAVTSIPVISRIMFDLGILETSFARIVLGAAVIEDIILYVVLAVAIGMVGGQHGELTGLQAVLGLEPFSAGANAYHLVVPVAFIVLSLLFGPRLFRKASRFRYNLLAKGSPIAFLLVFMLVMMIGISIPGIHVPQRPKTAEPALEQSCRGVGEGIGAARSYAGAPSAHPTGKNQALLRAGGQGPAVVAPGVEG